MLTAGEYFKNVYRSVPKSIIVCDEGRQIVFASSAGAPFTEKELPAPLWEEAEACISTGCGTTVSLRWNERTRVVYCTPCHYDGKAYCALEIATLTEYPELPELMVALTNARGKLSAYLDTIYFTAQQMGFDTKAGKEMGMEVRRILRAAEHLDRLLDMSDRVVYRVPLDLNRFVTAFADGVCTLQLQDSFILELSEEPLIARFMPEDVEIVLATLISNAFRFGAGGVALRTARVGKKVRITVADNGPGAEDPERLFDCGYRTRDKKGGEGLGFGLAMARHVLARQEATLLYERTGGDTRFHIDLDEAILPKGMRLSEWKPEDLRNTLSPLWVELSDYMIAMED